MDTVTVDGIETGIEISYLPGDIDFDGEVTNKDYDNISINVPDDIIELNGLQKIVADVNGDGTIDTTDGSCTWDLCNGIISRNFQINENLLKQYFDI